MHPYLYTALGICFIFLMTTLGSALVFIFKKELSHKFKEAFLGLASGVMVAASIFSLLIPAMEYDTKPLPSYVVVVIGFLAGGGVLFLLDKLVPHLHSSNGQSEGREIKPISKNTKLFLAVTLHNIPEGLSVGLAFGLALAGNIEGATMMGAMGLALGIGIQNFPEGTALALPIMEETKSRTKGFLYGTASGAVEPIAALIGVFISALTTVMPWALSFAAGAMIYVVIDELIPSASNEDSHFGVWGTLIGFAIMMTLDVALG